MSGSNLTPFTYIAENSLATPGLWNSIFSTLSQNIAEANTPSSILSGGISLSTRGLTINVPSDSTDYIFLNDSANLRSSYVIGSFNTGTADGLNIFDASGQTMVVSFSKQSIRFFQQVIGPVFDLGGALTGTINAATFGTASDSTETRIQAAINSASQQGVPRVYLPSTFYPYSASSVSFIYTVQMVREGGTFDVYDVKAYGASGNTTADDTAAWQAAENSRALAVSTLYAPAGAYKITSVITSSAAYTHWRGESGAVILCNTTTTPCVQFVAGTIAQGQYHTVRVENLRIRNQVSAHRIPMILFGDPHALTGLNINDLELDANFLPRDGITLDRVFEGALRLVDFENFQSNGTGLGVGCNFRATNLNSGNIHFDTWTSTTNPILFLLNENPGQNNVLNSLHFNNCKLGRGTFVNANKFFAGTVSGSQATSATTILLAAGQGSNFALGDWITVVKATTGALWVDRITAVNTDTLSLASQLPFSLANSDACVLGYWHTIVGPNVTQVHFTVPHFERCNGIFGSGANEVCVDKPSLGPGLLRGVYLNRDCQGWEMRQPGEVTALSSSAIVFHQAGAGFTNRNRLVGPVKITSGATVIQRDQGTTVGYVGRFGGTESLLGIWHQSSSIDVSQTSVQLVGPNMGANRGVRMRAYGSFVALNVQTRVSRSAGTLTAVVFVNNSASIMSTTIDVNNTFNHLYEVFLDSDAVPFNAGDLVDVRVTTTSDWAPTANDLDASLYVSQ